MITFRKLVVQLVIIRLFLFLITFHEKLSESVGCKIEMIYLLMTILKLLNNLMFMSADTPNLKIVSNLIHNSFCSYRSCRNSFN
jgi:hypothetical protein